MKNIVLAGLEFDTNLGDQAIYLSTCHMVETILKENDIQDIELRGLDLYGRISEERYVYERSLMKKVFCKVWTHLDRGRKLYNCQEALAGKNIQEICSRKIDEDTMAIIFGGGGIIKFSYQYFPIQVLEIIRFAENKNIPVMLSAVGIEGYDESNKSCQKLKQALNSPCVKYITTRDDLDLLERCYCPSADLIKARVADPACSIAKVYPEKKRKGGWIGIGVAREGLFVDNGISLDKEEMLSFWAEIYKEIEKRGYKVRIFSNGLEADQQFGKELVKYMQLENENEVLCERPESVEELLDILMQFEGAFTVRLHASILSYAFEIPTVGLIWNDKQKMFGNIIKHPERFFEVGNNAAQIIEVLLKSVEMKNEKIDQKYCDSTKIYLQRFIEDYVIDRSMV